MARFSLQQLRGLALQPLSKAVRPDARTILREASSSDSRSRHDIFLSYNHLDKEAVLGLKTLLELHDYSVYVDSESDPQLDPTKVDEATVDQVRRRLRASTSLLYATSENAEGSKWMAWELGLGDGLGKRVAVVPITGGMGTLASREFLLIYPEVREGPPHRPLEVRRPNGTVGSFSDWLRGE
jgi:hypothetical protein